MSEDESKTTTDKKKIVYPSITNDPSHPITTTMEQQIMTPNIRDDLWCRFLLNVPASELNDINRVFYHLECCWWFYVDHYDRQGFSTSTNNSNSTNEDLFLLFLQKLFDQGPAANSTFDIYPCVRSSTVLRKLVTRTPTRLRQAYMKYLYEYKYLIPVFGTAILYSVASDYYVLMIKAAVGDPWGFPKGKQNQHEDGIQTAIRETAEEIGFQLQEHHFQPIVVDTSETSTSETTTCASTTTTNNKKHYLSWKNKNVTIYPIVNCGLTFDSHFKSQYNYEIAEYKWLPLRPLHQMKEKLTWLARKMWPYLTGHFLPADSSTTEQKNVS